MILQKEERNKIKKAAKQTQSGGQAWQRQFSRGSARF
jgi:hypothetical protein